VKVDKKNVRTACVYKVAGEKFDFFDGVVYNNNIKQIADFIDDALGRRLGQQPLLADPLGAQHGPRTGLQQ